ncbi:MAG: PAS domain-containing protein [Alphaproteobacteria bacterium]|nr:PAS domain-containing protein [Alphaproteobacteria bacterium]
MSFWKKITSLFDTREIDTVSCIFESEKDALALVDFEGTLICMNEAGRLFFKNDDLYTAVTKRILIDEDSNKLALAKLQAGLQSTSDIDIELVMKAENSDFWEWYSVSVKYLEVGRLWRVKEVTSDHAFHAVSMQEKQDLSNLIDSLPVGIYQVNAGNEIQFVNQRLCSWLGFSDTVDLIGKKINDYIVGDVPDLDGSWRGQLEFKTKVAGDFTAFVSHVIYDDNGETKLQGCVVRDVSEVEEKKHKEQKDEVHIPRLFEESPVGIAVLDKSNKFTEANGAVLTILEKSRDELIGLKLEELIANDDWSELQEKMAKLMLSKTVKINSNIKLKKNSNKSVAVHITPLIDEDEEGILDIFGFVVYFIDNTQQTKLSEHLAENDKMNTVGKLAGGIAHDVNNQLTAILMATDLLLGVHPMNDPDYEDLNMISQSAKRAGSLVGELLSFARKKPKILKYIDVNEILPELVYFIKRSIGSQKFNINIDNGRNIGFIHADRDEFNTILTNLAFNSRDAMPEGGTLTFKTRVVKFQAGQYIQNEEVLPGEYIAVDVTDTGCGMDENTIKRIFEPFFTTKTKGEDSGTGMGLSVVFGTIHQWGGYVNVTSVVNKGTTFSLYLPRFTQEYIDRTNVSEQSEDKNKKEKIEGSDFKEIQKKEEKPKVGDQLAFSFLSSEKKKVTIEPDLLGKETILMVDDEDMVRAVHKKALTAKGYQVIDCFSAEDALEKIASGVKFDLLITDMVMPGLSGAQLATKLRADGIHTKILMISGFSEEAASGEIKMLKDFYFMSKPFTLKELGEKVKSILQEEN